MSILIHTDDPAIARPLLNRLKAQGLSAAFYEGIAQLEPLDVANNPVYFILYSPVRHAGAFYYTAPLWKRFFQTNKQFENIRLIVAAYAAPPGQQDANYLCLLQLPENFSMWLKESKACSGNWLPQKTFGTNVQELLKRFYVGHGNDSVIAAFDKVSRVVKDIEKYRHTLSQEALIDPEKGMYTPENLSDTWRLFCIRWQHFKPLVPLLPFADAFFKLNELIKNADMFFANGSKDLILFVEKQVYLHVLEIEGILNKYKNLTSD